MKSYRPKVRRSWFERKAVQVFMKAFDLEFGKHMDRRERRAILDEFVRNIRSDQIMWEAKGDQIRAGFIEILNKLEKRKHQTRDMKSAVFMIRLMCVAYDQGFIPLIPRITRQAIAPGRFKR